MSHPEHDDEPACLGAGPELRGVIEQMTVLELVELAISLGVPAPDLLAVVTDPRSTGG